MEIDNNIEKLLTDYFFNIAVSQLKRLYFINIIYFFKLFK